MTDPNNPVASDERETRTELDDAIAAVEDELRVASPEESTRLAVELVALLDRRHREGVEVSESIGAVAQRLGRAVTGLADITEVGDLVREACQRVAQVSGARRVVLSRLLNRRMVPIASFDENVDAENTLPDEFVANDESVEYRALSTASIVTVQAGADGRQWLGHNGFTVLPIDVGGAVVALLHLDTQTDGPTSDALGVLAEMLGVCLDRVGLESRSARTEYAVVSGAGRLLSDARSAVRGRQSNGRDGSTREHLLLDSLTGREADVARLVLTGASNSAVAAELVITVDTVKSHVKSILRKSGTTNRAELISKYRSGPI